MKRILCFSLMLLTVYGSADAGDKIRIAIPEPNAAYMTFPLAYKKGFFTDQGFTAEVISMTGILAMSALKNGELDYLTDISQGARGLIGGFQVKAVSCFLPRSSLMVLSRPDINKVSELKGKTVAVANFGGSNFSVLQLIAKHFGLDPEKEIKVLAVGPNQSRLAALKQGLVAAAVVQPPWDFQAKKLGFHVIAKSYELFNYPQAGLVAHERKIKQRPDEIKRIIKAGIEANRYIRKNREGTVNFLMDWMRLDRDVAAATYDAFLPALNDDGNCPEDGMHLVIEEAKKAAKVSRDISIQDLADLSILREAQKEIGIVAR